MTGKPAEPLDPSPPTIEETASETFVRRLHGEWTPADLAALEARLKRDPAYADAYVRVKAAWDSLDTYAEAPEFMAYREQAIAYACDANADRWLKASRYARNPWRNAAVAAGIALAIATGWNLSPYGYRPGQYQTDVGEQRIVEMEDHSRIALDTATRLKVRYTDDARIVQLQEGQAQFSVAKDRARPFKVVAGDRTIIAIGTVFTVEYVDRTVHVAMMEGKVAVVPAESAHPGNTRPSSSSPPVLSDEQGVRLENGSALVEKSKDDRNATIELIAGEELRVSRDGENTVTPKADIEAATAWREGKVIIRRESLGDAVRRLNRYSRRQIQIDDAALAAKLISGVFEAGDTEGFVSAVQRYLPVTVDESAARTIKLQLQISPTGSASAER
jgi:transmembrane sensor